MKLTIGNQCGGLNNGLCYDSAGNVIFDNTLGSAGNRAYDAENRMTSAAGNNGANSYSYNADGRRTRRQVGSQQYWQVYGLGGELVAEYLWNGTTATLQKEYGSGSTDIIAESATVVRWLVKDHLGTARIIADQTGSLAGITRHDYLPFGEENFAGSVRMGNGYQEEGVRQQFTGYEHDDETGLDFAEARYCSTKQGRFTSPDPLASSASLVEPQSWNRYSYVGNRPLIVTDPSGLKWFYNTKTNKYGWCNCETLNRESIDAGWTEITAQNSSGLIQQFSNGSVIYRSASGAIIRLPGQSGVWENLTAALMAEERFQRIAAAKQNAEAWANAILLDFITTSVGYGVTLATGGIAGVAKEFVIDQAVDYATSKLTSSNAEQAGLYPYQVGTASVLQSLQESHDGLQIHHVPQGQPASQVIPGYDYKNAPAIALPDAEHRQIPNSRGQYSGTAEDLIKRDINNLRKHTNAPEGSIKKLQKLIRKIL